VLGSFNDGGASSGQSSDTQNSYELQNYTSMLRGKHSWKFGVRLRGQTDDSVAPQNFNLRGWWHDPLAFSILQWEYLKFLGTLARLSLFRPTADPPPSETLHQAV
jgi:hypothetical protein